MVGLAKIQDHCWFRNLWNSGNVESQSGWCPFRMFGFFGMCVRFGFFLKFSECLEFGLQKSRTMVGSVLEFLGFFGAIRV